MADIETALDEFDKGLGDLETSIAGTQAVSAVFQQELEGMRGAISAAGTESRALTRSLSTSLKNAFSDLLFDGAKLTDVLAGLARNMANAAFNSAMSPVTDAIGGFLGRGMENMISAALPFKDGAAFSGGRVAAFARGGIVDGPTHFPMRGGVGLMGEAGPEAIMPLSRGADGKLGVRGGGASAVHVTMNIQTPDVAGFQRSRSQIAASMQRAMQSGSRNL